MKVKSIILPVDNSKVSAWRMGVGVKQENKAYPAGTYIQFFNTKGRFAYLEKVTSPYFSDGHLIDYRVRAENPKLLTKSIKAISKYLKTKGIIVLSERSQGQPPLFDTIVEKLRGR